MVTEHKWVPGMVQELDAALLNLGFGESPSTPNLFGMVGFGKRESWGRRKPFELLGRTLTLDDGRSMYPSSEFVQVAAMLESRGAAEDGYQAMEHAVQKLHLRDSEHVERILILVTDEDRDVIPQGQELTQRTMTRLLGLKRVAFHVVVDQQFLATGGIHPFGMNASNWGFLATDKDGVQALPRTRNGVSYQNTYSDYTHFALRLKGTAWDTVMIRMGGGTTRLFTQTFTRVVAAQTYHVRTACLKTN